MKSLLILFLSLVLPTAVFGADANGSAKPYLTLFGEPKYKPGFTHYDYANPDAPKGGTIKLMLPSTFDSLNPYILKGVAVPQVGTYTIESLMTASLDEPQSYYPLLAQSVALSPDKSQAVFTMNPKARWHDGTPVTAADVVYSLQLMKTKADPTLQLLYKPVEATAEGNTVVFRFLDLTNRELPFQTAAMPVLQKAYYETHPFEKTSLQPPVGSGPYKVGQVEPGRFVVFERVKDYWGKDLPTRRGLYNFDTIRIDVYRDETVALEAFKAHQYDLREEYIARNWANGYDFPAVREGRVKKFEEPMKSPRGMQAFLFNLRKDKFADPRVRKAIGLTLDFEWLNHALFYDAYTRNDSFFQNTPFSADTPPTEGEKALLEPFRAELPPEVFTTVWQPPKSDGSGNIRPRLIEAQRLLNEAGWKIKDGKRVDPKTGEPMEIEFMMSQTTFQRVVMPMIRNLSRLGITARFRLVDDAQYQQRWQTKDFDIVSIWWNLGVNFPGAEQENYWNSKQADIKGGGNISGLKSPAVDALVARIVAAHDLADLTDAARALDRVLLWKEVVIPHWTIRRFRTAYWNRFGIPKVHPGYALGLESWWVKEPSPPR